MPHIVIPEGRNPESVVLLFVIPESRHPESVITKNPAPNLGAGLNRSSVTVGNLFCLLGRFGRSVGFGFGGFFEFLQAGGFTGEFG